MCSPQAMFGNQWTDRDLRIAASRRLATVGEPKLRCLLNVRVAPQARLAEPKRNQESTPAALVVPDA